MKTSANNFIVAAYLREVLECASPLALFVACLKMSKWQKTIALQNAVPSPLGGERVRVKGEVQPHAFFFHKRHPIVFFMRGTGSWPA